jgi:hypothetical protein
MAEKKDKKDWKENVCTRGKDDAKCGASSAIYGLGLIGALIYNISVATGFWNIIWAIIKAFLWPAFLVYELYKYLGM